MPSAWEYFGHMCTLILQLCDLQALSILHWHMYIYIYMCMYMYIHICICVFAYVNIYQDYLYAVFYTFTCYAQQSCYNKGMDARQWVTLPTLSVRIQVQLLI